MTGISGGVCDFFFLYLLRKKQVVSLEIPLAAVSKPWT